MDAEGGGEDGQGQGGTVGLQSQGEDSPAEGPHLQSQGGAEVGLRGLGQRAPRSEEGPNRTLPFFSRQYN